MADGVSKNHYKHVILGLFIPCTPSTSVMHYKNIWFDSWLSQVKNLNSGPVTDSKPITHRCTLYEVFIVPGSYLVTSGEEGSADRDMAEK